MMCNAPCDCGSGLRYKHCCGVADADALSPLARHERRRNEALALHRRGDFSRAIESYEAILFDHPDELLEKVYLRIGMRNRSRVVNIMVTFSRSGTPGVFQCRLTLDAEGGPPDVPLGQAALKSVLEVQIDLDALETFASGPFQFQTALWTENLPLESLPLVGWSIVQAPEVLHERAQGLAGFVNRVPHRPAISGCRKYCTHIRSWLSPTFLRHSMSRLRTRRVSLDQRCARSGK